MEAKQYIWARVAWGAGFALGLAPMLAGAAQGLSGAFDSAFVLLGTSVAVFLAVAMASGVYLYLRAPRRSQALVTWPALMGVPAAAFFSVVSWLAWITFQLGQLKGQVG